MQMTIRKKLWLAFGGLIALFIVSGLYFTYVLSAVNDASATISSRYVQKLSLVNDISVIQAEYKIKQFSYLTARSLPDKIRFEQETLRLGSELDIMLDNLAGQADEKDKATIDAVRAQWTEYKRLNERSFALKAQEQTEAALAALNDMHLVFDEMSAGLFKLVDHQKDTIRRASFGADQDYRQAKWQTTLFLLLVVAVAGSTAWYLGRNISRGVRLLLQASGKMAEGDLRVSVETGARDEMGLLAASYQKTAEHLRGLVDNIQRTAQEVAGFSETLTVSAEQSATASAQVADSISNVAQSAGRQEEAVQTASGVVADMARQMQRASAAAAASTSDAADAAAAAESGRTALERAVTQMASIAATVSDSAQVIAQLDARSKEIGQIVDAISGIAGQTNLLALNAAIEAARAGEQGRGFSVVAEEVRKLAEESAAAAGRIAALVAAIQSDTGRAVERMNEGTKEVEAGSAVVHAAGDNFQAIAAAVDKIAAQIRDVSATIHSAAEASQQIVGSTEEIGAASRNVAEETEAVSAATEEQSATMEQIASASRKLEELAQGLRAAVGRFKV